MLIKELTCYEVMNIECCLYRKTKSVFVVLSAISITDISPDTESREEQDGANHFSIQPRMAELWPNLCGDVGEKGDGLFLFL